MPECGMTEDPRWGELGKFLRARRAGLSPSMVGLPESTNARRVPGLRREEVADLAAISADYLPEAGTRQAGRITVGARRTGPGAAPQR